MHICGLEKFSMVDYPKKIACTVFTYGCNFRCPFCHNADLVVGRPGGTIDEEAIFAYLAERKKLIDGVVISGGEPTLQPDLAAFVGRVKALGLLVKLDTNGTNPFILKSLLEKKQLDYVAMDVKSGPAGYKLAAGVAGDVLPAVSRSIALLVNGEVDYEFRTTIVDELHTEVDIRGLGELIRGAKRCFLQRFEDTGTCVAPGLHPVPKEKAVRYAAILENYKIGSVQLRNYPD